MGIFDIKNNKEDPAVTKQKADYSNALGEAWVASAKSAKSYAEEAARKTAPQMVAAQLGAAPTMTAANVGRATLSSGTVMDQTQANEARKVQMDALAQMQAQSLGGGPSLAGAQMNASMDANLANQLSAAGSSRGGMLAGRALLDAGAMQGQQTGQQAAIARMAEQQAAQGQLGSLAGGTRGQDLGAASQQASLDQATSLANMSAQNQFLLAQAGMDQQANAANQGMAGQFGMQQGQFNQGANASNLSANVGQDQHADALRQWGLDRWWESTSKEADRAAGASVTQANREAVQRELDRQRQAQTLAAMGNALAQAQAMNEKENEKGKG